MFQKKAKYTLYVGETGARLYDEGLVLKGKALTPEDANDLAMILKAAPDEPLHVVVDHSALTLEDHVFPKIGLLNLFQMMTRKVADFRTQYPRSGTKRHRRGLTWSMTQMGLDAALDPWWVWLANLPNEVITARALPYEMCTLLPQISNGQPWQMVVILEDPGFIRLSVFHYHRLVMTRLLPLTEERDPLSMGAQLSSTLHDSLQYLLRKEGTPSLHLVGVFEDDLKPSLNLEGFMTTTLMSPQTFASRLQLNCTQKTSSEVLVLEAILRHKPLLSLSLQPQKPREISLEPLWVRMGASGVAVLMGVYGSYEAYNIVMLTQDIGSLAHKQAGLQMQNHYLKDALGSVDVSVMRTSLKAYETVKNQERTILTVLPRLHGAVGEHPIAIDGLEWKGEEVPHLRLSFSVESSSKDKESVRDEFDGFVDSLRGEFGDDHVHVIKAPFNLSPDSAFSGGKLHEDLSTHGEIEIQEVL